MGYQQNSQERRTGQRRRHRACIQFPITDGRGCIVPFDRSRIADRRLENPQPGETLQIAAPDNSLPGCQRPEDTGGLNMLPLVLDSARDFSVSGKLIASTSNIDSSQSSGNWKELELYQTLNGEYVCLEIWRSILDEKYDQYWLATCNDLKTAREFFGNNRLADELFHELLTDLSGTSS